MKKVIPTFYSKNIFEIEYNFYHKLNIKYLLVDLDNTLDSFKNSIPSNKAMSFVSSLKKENIELIIVSNNNKKRVEKYAINLNVKFIYKCYKPFTKKINKYLKDNNINKENCIMIGDQLSTDIKCGVNLNIKTILVDDLVNENQLVTKFNKFMARRALNKLKKENKLNYWRDSYGRI